MTIEDLFPAGRSALPWPYTGDEGQLWLTIGQPRPDRVVVRAVGELDVVTALTWSVALRSALDRLHTGALCGRWSQSVPWPHLRDVGGGRLVVDMTGVVFLGAAGLSVLVEVLARADTDGVSVVLVSHTRVVGRALEAGGVHAVVARRLLTALGPSSEQP